MHKAFVLFALSIILAPAAPASAGPPPSRSALEALSRIAAQTGRDPEYVISRRDGTPTVILGDLSTKTNGNALIVARNFIARNQELFPVDPTSLRLLNDIGIGNGRTVRFEQTYKGIPVLGSHVALFVREDGVVKIATSSLVNLDGLPAIPRVSDVQAAITAFRKIPWVVPNNLDNFFARLVVLPFSGAGILAWEVHFGAVPALLSNVFAYVDAQTGDFIKHENRIVFESKGLAYETNPGPPSDRAVPKEVVLDIPAGGFKYTEPDYRPEMIEHVKTACDYADGDEDCPDGNAIWLRHPLFLARNCPDYHETIEINFGTAINAHMCSEVQTAHADPDGNFFFADWQDSRGDFTDYYDSSKPETILAMSDKFAEVQMFYHVGKIYNYFLNLMDDYSSEDPSLSDLGRDWGGHVTRPLMATVNFKIPINMGAGMPDLSKLGEVIDPNGPLYPFDNAFFMPGGPAMGIPGMERPFDSIVFGQGSRADFGWDGDVIYHEFTHSVDQSVTFTGTAGFNEFGDEWGVNPEPGGMSEGYADAFPGFVTRDPTMGEYSMGAMQGSTVRRLDAMDICPNYLVGEVHDDSHGWSQSLYQASEAVSLALAGEMDDSEVRHKFEQAVFIGLSSIVANQGFKEPAKTTLFAISDLLGETAKNAAEEVFSAHNIDDCQRYIDDDGTGEIKHHTGILGLALPSAVSGLRGKPYTPGIVQYRVTVGEGVKGINFSVMVAQPAAFMGMAQGVTKIKFLVRHNNPIQFQYDFEAEENVVVDDDVMGPYIPEKVGNVNQGQQATFSLVGKDSGFLPPGEYYLMPVNAGAARGALHNMEVTNGAPLAGEDGIYEYGSLPRDPSVDNPDDSDTDTNATDDGETDNDPHGDSDAGTDDSNSTGCGCIVTGSQNGTGGLAKRLLKLLIMVE